MSSQPILTSPILTPHRRFNPLTREWVLVSPHRTAAALAGTGRGDRRAAAQPEYDPECYLCPGNARAGGVAQSAITHSTFVFDNDFAALQARYAGRTASTRTDC